MTCLLAFLSWQWEHYVFLVFAFLVFHHSHFSPTTVNTFCCFIGVSTLPWCLHLGWSAWHWWFWGLTSEPYNCIQLVAVQPVIWSPRCPLQNDCLVDLIQNLIRLFFALANHSGFNDDDDDWIVWSAKARFLEENRNEFHTTFEDGWMEFDDTTSTKDDEDGACDAWDWLWAQAQITNSDHLS